MQAEILLRNASTGGSVVLVVDASNDATTDELLDSLSHQLPSPTSAVFHRGAKVERGRSLRSIGLAHGSVLDIGEPVVESPFVRSPRLWIESGVSAGEVVPLRTGTWTLGRSGQDITIADPSISATHCQIRVDTTDGTPRIFVSDLGSTNGTLVDGLTVARGEEIELLPGKALTAGRTRLSFAIDPPPELEIVDDPETGEQQVKFQKRVDTYQPPAPVSIVWPSEPKQHEPPKIPVAMMLIPLVFAVLMAVFMDRASMLLFALMSPVMAMVNWNSERSRRRRETSEESVRYREALSKAKERIARQAELELRANQGRLPSLAETVETAVLRSGRLWQRSPSDDDALELRIGVVDRQPETVTLEAGRDAEPPELKPLVHNPVGLSLREAGNLGIAGPDEQARGLARSLLLQLATFHSPHQLQLSAIFRDSGQSDFEWVRWLPHFRSGTAVRVGITDESSDALLTALVREVNLRHEQVSEARGRLGFVPHVVLLEQTASLPPAKTAPLLERGPEVGVHCIVVESQRSAIPNSCRAAVSIAQDAVHHDWVATVERPNGAPVRSVELELLPSATARRASISMAPLRPFSPDAEVQTDLPDIVFLADLLGVRDASPEDIRLRWKERSGRPIATLGVSTSGPVIVDFEDTPHMLVAGTTGAGKSELLRTLLASLALNNSPEDVNFVFIDFKGGGALKTFSRTAHCVATVLSGAPEEDVVVTPPQRTIRSLEVELSRRETLFSDYDGSISVYERARRTDPTIGPKMARIFIVFDEYASFIAADPDADKQLVSIAQRGRSLGMHLVIGTQQPSTSVSRDIAAQLPLSAALRLKDPIESDNVIGAPDAAHLPLDPRGRAFIRQGTDLTLTQVAVVGVAPAQHVVEKKEMTVRERLWAHVPASVDGPAVERQLVDPDAPSDLSKLVDLLAEAGAPPAFAPQPSPVPPALPMSVSIDELRVDADDLDDPHPQWIEERLWAQRLRRTAWDPGDGHLLIVGSPKTGRSTALRTIVGSLATARTPDSLHIYVIDLQGGLGQLSVLPHVGAVATAVDPLHLTLVLASLDAELQRRRDLVTRHGVASIAEVKEKTRTDIADIVVVVDNVHALLGIGPERELGHLMAILKDGQSYGMTVVAAGDTDASRLDKRFENRIVLRFNDTAAYGDFQLSTALMRTARPPLRPGEGLRLLAVGQRDELVALQIGHLGTTPDSVGATAALDAIAAAHASTTSGLPNPLKRLPYPASAADFLSSSAPPPAHQIPVLVAVAAGSLEPCWVDLAAQRSFVVTGPPVSGRTTTLNALRRQLTDRGVPVATVAHGMTTDEIRLLDGDVVMLDQAARLIPTLAPDTVVFVDDFERIENSDFAAALPDLLDTPQGPTIVVSVVTESLLSGARRPLRKLAEQRTGMVFNPVNRALTLLLSRMPWPIDSPAGRGYVIDRGNATLAQAITLDES